MVTSPVTWLLWPRNFLKVDDLLVIEIVDNVLEVDIVIGNVGVDRGRHLIVIPVEIRAETALNRGGFRFGDLARLATNGVEIEGLVVL